MRAVFIASWGLLLYFGNIMLLGGTSWAEVDGDLLSGLQCTRCHKLPGRQGRAGSVTLTFGEMTAKFTQNHVNRVARGAQRVVGMPVIPLTPVEANGVVAAIFQDIEADGWRTVKESANVGQGPSDTFAACSACHHKKSSKSIALDQFASVYQPNYLKNILLAGLPGGTRCENKSSPMTLTSVNEFLAELKTGNSEGGQASSAAQPRIDWLNAAGCAQCHSADAAPYLPLAEWVGAVNKKWLVGFLESPKVIRPSGVTLGDGSRHPRYQLSAKERRGVLRRLWRHRIQTTKKREPKQLSPARNAAVADLLNTRYGCVGCHTINNAGGRIGPSLDEVGSRLTPGAIWSILNGDGALTKNWPHAFVAPYRNAQKDLWRFLVHRREVADDPPQYVSYERLMPSPVRSEVSVADVSEGRRLFESTCAGCHGAKGNGRGFNAHFIPASPAKLNDGRRLEQITDDTLSMGIAQGGWVWGRSHLMPGFVGHYTAEQIMKIVAHIRDLCRCEGPSWSR